MVIFQRQKFQINSYKFKKYVHKIYKIMRDNPNSKKMQSLEKRISQKLKKYHKIYDKYHRKILKNFQNEYIKKFKRETKYSVMKDRVNKIGGEKQLSLIVTGNLIIKNYFILLRYKFIGILKLQKKHLEKIGKIRVVVNEGDKSISSVPMKNIEKFQILTEKTYRVAAENFNINCETSHNIIQSVKLGKFGNLGAFFELTKTDDFNEFVCEPIVNVFKEVNEKFCLSLEHLISVLNLHLQYCNSRYYMKLSFDDFKIFYEHIYNEIEKIESVIDY